MVKSMIAGVAGLRAHQSKMDVIGNNIANVNTYGFKSARAAFRDALYATTTGSSDAGTVYGGGNAQQVGYGSTLGSIDVMHVRGAYTPTDYPSDCMINGNGYFLVGPTGSGTPGGAPGYAINDVTALNLTRVGVFGFDGSGNFVDINRNHVYGFMPNAWDDNGNVTGYDQTQVVPIVLPNLDPDDPAQGKVTLSQITIAEDGVIMGVDQNSNPVEVGRIAVANVPNPNGLEATTSSYYKAKANTGDVVASIPGQNTTGGLKAGGLEMSTVDLAREFSDMITTQRGYQANTRIITVTDEMLQELVNIKR